ncbi:MAG TPA: LytR family transcriptional regulator [Bacillus bacterium]|uniref:LCP family protein n=1 Tax=Siminovitchia fordii TaxID=254759 RepID=UPI0003706ED2|nr:LCP family protein [Siminovitchia fordii]HBZ10612.1 LytR family transcriptional regulator [Bacillus sp. (in: firmicutes)]
MGTRVRKTTKRKWIRNISILFFVLILTAGTFSVFQYYKGVSEAKDGPYKDDGKTFDPFNGPEPQFGEINILVIGSDSRGEDRGNSDTLMIAHYDQNTHDIKLASIMRDTYVDIPEHGMRKINAAFAYGGPELLRQTIKRNFDIDINYYAVVGFDGFSKIVDVIAPDGIEVDIPYEMSYGIGMTLHPGKQVLHGEELLGYVRFRHDRLSDFGRVDRQQEVMSKLKDEAVSIHSLVNLPKMLGMADPYVDTNVDTGTILAIGKGLIAGKSRQMETLRLPIQDSFVDESADVGAVLRIDFDKNKQALKEFLASKENGEIAAQ